MGRKQREKVEVEDGNDGVQERSHGNPRLATRRSMGVILIGLVELDVSIQLQ